MAPTALASCLARTAWRSRCDASVTRCTRAALGGSPGPCSPGPCYCRPTPQADLSGWLGLQLALIGGPAGGAPSWEEEASSSGPAGRRAGSPGASSSGAAGPSGRQPVRGDSGAPVAEDWRGGRPRAAPPSLETGGPRPGAGTSSGGLGGSGDAAANSNNSGSGSGGGGPDDDEAQYSPAVRAALAMLKFYRQGLSPLMQSTCRWGCAIMCVCGDLCSPAAAARGARDGALRRRAGGQVPPANARRAAAYSLHAHSAPARRHAPQVSTHVLQLLYRLLQKVWRLEGHSPHRLAAAALQPLGCDATRGSGAAAAPWRRQARRPLALVAPAYAHHKILHPNPSSLPSHSAH